MHRHHYAYKQQMCRRLQILRERHDGNHTTWCAIIFMGILMLEATRSGTRC